MWWFTHTLFLWRGFPPSKKKSLRSLKIHTELCFSLQSSTLSPCHIQLHAMILMLVPKMFTDDSCLCDTMTSALPKSPFRLHHDHVLDYADRLHPFPVFPKKKVRFHWRRREESYFKPFLFFYLLVFSFLQRTLESLNDRLFEAGKTFKDNQFQPCHLALVVIRDCSIYMQWKEKLGLGIRNLSSSAGSASFVTVGWSLNLFKGPQLWKGMVIMVPRR